MHASIIISTNNYSVPSLRAVEIEMFLGGDITHSDLHFYSESCQSGSRCPIIANTCKQRISDENNVSDFIVATSCMQHLSIEVV